MSVQVVVPDANPHAGLFDAVIIEPGAPLDALLAESAVMVVHQQQAGAGIAGHKNIRPAVLVEIGRDRGEAVTTFDFSDPRRLADIAKRAIPVVAKDVVKTRRKAARTAVHSDILEHTVLILSR